MRNFKLAVAAVLLAIPGVGLTQSEAVKLGQKQKAWTAANYRSFECTQTQGSPAVLSGAGTVSFDADADGGVELAVAPGEGGAPTITAHAINTKGTGATNGRAAPQACGAARSSRVASAATCSVSGDEQSPTVRFTVPLNALGGAEAGYLGTVTIVKGASSEPMVGKWLSKKGYDYYQAASDRAGAATDVLVLARCDSAALTSKGGKPTTATYDLAVAKK